MIIRSLLPNIILLFLQSHYGCEQELGPIIIILPNICIAIVIETINKPRYIPRYVLRPMSPSNVHVQGKLSVGFHIPTLIIHLIAPRFSGKCGQLDHFHDKTASRVAPLLWRRLQNNQGLRPYFVLLFPCCNSNRQAMIYHVSWWNIVKYYSRLINHTHLSLLSAKT